MTTIYISQSNCIKDGNKMVFSVGSGTIRGGNTYIVSKSGIIATRKGVEATCLIPWEEIDKAVAQHEPSLAVVKNAGV